MLRGLGGSLSFEMRVLGNGMGRGMRVVGWMGGMGKGRERRLGILVCWGGGRLWWGGIVYGVCMGASRFLFPYTEYSLLLSFSSLFLNRDLWIWENSDIHFFW